MKNQGVQAMVALLFAVGCSASVEGGGVEQVGGAGPTEEPVACAEPVTCHFPNGGCHPDHYVYWSAIVFNNERGCWLKAATCYPIGTPAECVPPPCHFEVGVSCE